MGTHNGSGLGEVRPDTNPEKTASVAKAIVVERLTHHDIPEICGLYKRVWEPFKSELPSEILRAWTPTPLEFTSSMEGVTYFAARRDAKMVGAIGCQTYDGSCPDPSPRGRRRPAPPGRRERPRPRRDRVGPAQQLRFCLGRRSGEARTRLRGVQATRLPGVRPLSPPLLYRGRQVVRDGPVGPLESRRAPPPVGSEAVPCSARSRSRRTASSGLPSA